MKTKISSRDYYFYRRNLYTIQYAFEYTGAIDIDAFRDALIELVKLMPVLTSRICVDSNAEISLVSTDADIPLRVCDLSAKVSDQVIEDADTLVDTVTNTEGEALLKVVITQAAQKTYLGFSFSHLLGDGFSFFNFLRGLSDVMTTGCVTAEVPAFLSREVLRGPPREHQEVNSERLFRETGYVIPRPPSPIATVCETIAYSKNDLLSLKQAASLFNSRVTTNDAVMADLLKRYYRSVPLAANGELIVRCPVDYRRIYEPIPENYFGNALKDAVASFDPQEFPDLSLATVASTIREAIETITPHAIERELQCFDDLRRAHGADIFEQVGCPGLLVSNLSKLPVHRMDFGRGPPTRFLTSSLNPRLAVILSSDRGDGLTVRFRRPI